MEFLRRLKGLLPPQARKKAVLLLFGILLSAGLETFGVGVIMPFIAFVTNPGSMDNYPQIAQVAGWVGMVGNRNVLFFLAAGIMGLILLKNLYLYLFLKFQLAFVYQTTVDYTIWMMEKYLYVNYLFHINTNSSELLRNLKQEVPTIFTRALLPLVTLISELLVVASIFSLVLWIHPIPTLVGGSLIGVVAYVFFRSIRRKAKLLGQRRIDNEAETFKWINQSLQGIKEVRIFGREKYFLNQCDKAWQELARISIFEHLTGQIPRFFIESLMVSGMMLIIVLLLIQGTSGADFLPSLSLFGAAAFRLMPAANRILGIVLLLKMSGPAVDNLHNHVESLKDLEQRPQLDQSSIPKLPMGEVIQIKGVNFTYPNVEEPTLCNLSLDIPHNKSVAFIGSSGSGKTTLLGILLGLFRPQSGQVLVNGVDLHDNLPAWRKNLGYVPQDIYLIDDTMDKNIAFGLAAEEIDQDKLWAAIRSAQLDGFINELPEKEKTFVGERGVRISGGQRQRIGIARALYHNPEVLIFDEATSALDTETEKEITKSIEALAQSRTIIIVAHRLSTIENCDIIYRIDKGKLVETKLNQKAG